MIGSCRSCPSAARGHPAAPPKTVMNSRRRIASLMPGKVGWYRFKLVGWKWSVLRQAHREQPHACRDEDYASKPSDQKAH